MTTKKQASVTPLALLTLAGLLVVLCVLAIPMRRGATLWEAIAVLPQAVLWPVPVAFALPPLFSLAARVRPRLRRRPSPDRQALPVGSLAALADLLRRATDGRWARSRVASRLTRLAIHTACLRFGASEEEAWALFRREADERAPEVSRFLRREGLLGLSGEAFAALVDQTLTYLEQYEQET